jgi:hypothetical protein
MLLWELGQRGGCVAEIRHPARRKKIDKTNPINSFVFNKTKKKQTQIRPSKANLATLG